MFHALLAVLLEGGVGDDREALVLLVDVLPVGLEALQDGVPLVVGQLPHGASLEVLRHVAVVLVLRPLHLLVASLEVVGNLAVLLWQITQESLL